MPATLIPLRRLSVATPKRPAGPEERACCSSPRAWAGEPAHVTPVSSSSAAATETRGRTRTRGGAGSKNIPETIGQARWPTQFADVLRRARSVVVVDAPLRAGQPLPRAAPLAGDDLRGDRHGGLLRGAGPEVEPDRRGEQRELGLAEPRLDEPGEPFVVRATRAHRADVAGAYVLVEAQRDLEQRHVELRVVGQDGEDGASVDATRVE